MVIQNSNPRIVPRGFSHAPSPLLSYEGSVALQTPCHGIWAHGSGFWIASQRIPGSRSEHTARVTSVDGHITGLVLGMFLVVYGIQSIGCKNVFKSGTWQHLSPLTEKSTTGLFRFVTIYLVLKAETAVHGCLISTRVIWLCARVRRGHTTVQVQSVHNLRLKFF